MNKRNLLYSGFMLFSLFFGAGNLIFPPFLGMESGNYFIIAIIGFILTAVLIPFLSVISVALSENGLLAIGQRVHPIFGLIFAIVIYMSIGAFYGIPRAASVAYELGFIQIFSSSIESRLTLLAFSIIFFGLTYVISLNPKKIIDYVGQILTPILLLTLAILFIRAFTVFSYTDMPPAAHYQSNPFLAGFLDGYFTLDAIAALAFGIVIINGLKDKGITDKRNLLRATVIAGVIATIGLTVVYISLAWIGRVMPLSKTPKNGAEILVLASQQLFGFSGNILFGIIVILACLTTCIGLINACARFFNETFPGISYKNYVRIFTFIGLGFANLGLAIILKVAVPLLMFIYPIAIVLVVLSIFQHFFGGSHKMYVYATTVATIFAFYDMLGSFQIKIPVLHHILRLLPMFENGLGWVLPTLIAATIGYFIDYKPRGKSLKKAG
ncbi:branched-chain amino acid transport system II carrier protein [Virgibacillus soli]|uniref:branched-chain amino acid transport system II carrier protein n=1 Tax=Paracerasibacillus soli TaxID=480284 RepID=UPI0035E529AD